MPKPQAYDLFTHGTNIRVRETVAPHRHGLVVEIKEIKPDWVEPYVLWDGMNAPVASSPFLLNLEQPQ